MSGPTIGTSTRTTAAAVRTDRRVWFDADMDASSTGCASRRRLRPAVEGVEPLEAKTRESRSEHHTSPCDAPVFR
jgi:hypothetical protein